ncbi:MAG: HAD family hydrolase [bacterium]|nr:HAD family hydrolase [bacterium]
MFDEIFSDIPENQAKEIEQQRFDIREEKVQSSADLFFEGIEKVIKELVKRYHLVIISATDEDMSMEYLRTKDTGRNTDLSKYFDYVFGKWEPIFDWENIKRKSQLILKIVNILGVPIKRLVYVGDNNGDFLACKI